MTVGGILFIQVVSYSYMANNACIYGYPVFICTFKYGNMGTDRLMGQFTVVSTKCNVYCGGGWSKKCNVVRYCSALLVIEKLLWIDVVLKSMNSYDFVTHTSHIPYKHNTYIISFHQLL